MVKFFFCCVMKIANEKKEKNTYSKPSESRGVATCVCFSLGVQLGHQIRQSAS